MGLRLKGLFLGYGFACLLIAGCSSYSYQTDLLRAEQLEREGKSQDALAIYERTLSRVPQRNTRERASALINAGNCLTQLARLNEAFADFQQAAEVDPENLDARLHLAEFFVAAGVPNHATEHLSFVLSRNPDDAEALGLLGTVESAAQHYDRAKELLERSIANDPQRTNVAVALAEIYNREDKVPQARSVLLHAAAASSELRKSAFAWLALGRLEEQEGIATAAEVAYRSAVKADDSVLTNFRLAQFLERSSRVAEAEEILSHIDALRPGEPSALADFHLNRGRALEALKTYSSPTAEASTMAQSKSSPSYVRGSKDSGLASRMIEAQMQLDGRAVSKEKMIDEFSAKLLLSRYRNLLDAAAVAVLESEMALADGNLAEAESKANLAVARWPASAASHYVRGVVFKRQEKIAEAKAEWNSALDADSDYVPAQLALARQNLQEQDLLTAEEHVSSVVREEPANLNALCLYAKVLLAQGRLASARGIAKRALAVDSDSAEPRLILGEIELKAGHLGSAFIEFQHVLLLDTQSTEAMDGLLDVYRRGSVTRAVLEKMERVAEAPPSSAPLLEIAGRLYADKRLYKDAVRVLRRVMEIDPARHTAALALAEAQLNAGDQKSAAEIMMSGLSERKSPPSVLRLRAAQSQERGDSDAAIESYELAIKSGDRSALVANNLAWAYAQRGTKLDRALELASNAVDRNPKDAAALDTLGVVQLKRRNYTEAVGALERAISLMDSTEWHSQKPEVYRHLADAYLGAGLPTMSASALAKADQHSAK